jgi:hypothetical protein
MNAQPQHLSVLAVRPARNSVAGRTLAHAIAVETKRLVEEKIPSVIRASELVKELTLERRGRFVTFRFRKEAVTYFIHQGQAYIHKAPLLGQFPAHVEAVCLKALAAYAARL